MRILCVIEQAGWAESHLAGSIRALGHEVVVFYDGLGVGEFYGRSRRRERAEKNRALLSQASALRSGTGLDLIFCYVYDDFLQEETARAPAKLDVPMVNYNVDMATEWYRRCLTAPYFTMMLCAHRANMSQLARYNSRVLDFPMAARAHTGAVADGACVTARCAGHVRRHTHDSPDACAGAVASQRHSPRHLRKVLAGGPIKFRPGNVGKGPSRYPPLRCPKVARGRIRRITPRFAAAPFAKRTSPPSPLPARLCKGFVPDGVLNSLFAQGAINLGFTRMSGDDPAMQGVTQVKLRDFEVPMSGGFYLVEQAKEYDEFFRAGVEVETWATVEELIDKIRYYLRHDGERRRIAAAGRRRAVAEHTWDKRFSMLFAELGLKEDYPAGAGDNAVVSQ